MKRFFISIIFIIFIQNYLHCQQEATGKLVYQQENKTGYYSSIEMLFNKTEYTYTIGKGDARTMPQFQNKKFTSVEDSLEFEETIKRMNEELQQHPTRFYGNLSLPFVFNNFYDASANQTYCVRDSIIQMSWQLNTDTMTIAGMLCQKATGLRGNSKYEAWFAPSIPISAAPLFYRGLPGLLIKLVNLTNKSSFVMTELYWPYTDTKLSPLCDTRHAISQADLSALISNKNAKTFKMVETYQKALKENKKIVVGQ